MDIDNSNQGPQAPITYVSAQEVSPKKPNKLILLIVGIFALCLLSMGVYIIVTSIKKPPTQSKTNVQPSVVASPTPLVRDIEDATLVYEHNGVVLSQGSQSTPLVLDPNGISPSYSSVLQKIAYVVYGSTRDNAVYVYDIETKQIEERKETVGDGTLRTVMWSPDGKYLATIASTSVIGSITIYEYPSGKEVASFRAFGAFPEISWDNDGNLIFRDPESVTPPRQYESGEGQGIAKISLPSGQKQILLRADAKHDYYLLGVTDTMVYYVPFDPNNPSETNSGSLSTCSQITISGQGSRSVDCKSVPNQQIINAVSSRLPSSLVGYFVSQCIPNPKNANWLLCSFYKYNESDSSTSTKIGLFTRNNPQAEVTHIVDGNNASW